MNGTSIGLVTASPYQWTWNAVGQGSVDLKVIATDNEGNSNQLNTKVSVTDQPMVAAITSPSSGDVVAIGKAVTVNANVSSLQSEVAKVELYANGLLVSGDTTAPYQSFGHQLPSGTIN